MPRNSLPDQHLTVRLTRAQRKVVAEIAMASTARARMPPQRIATAAQSGLAERTERPTCTCQLSGLRDAMACIQPGMKLVWMNAVDRNISGSMKNV